MSSKAPSPAQASPITSSTSSTTPPMPPPAPSSAHDLDDMVRLNIGGTDFSTSLQTLTKYPASMLGRMFSSDGVPAKKDALGRYFIDRDPTHFGKILNFLRDGACVLPHNNPAAVAELLQEAKYYSLQELIEFIEEYDHDQASQTYKDTIAKLAGNNNVQAEIDELKREFIHKFSLGLPYLMDRTHPFFPSRRPSHIPLVLHALEKEGFIVDMKKERSKFGWYERLIFRWVHTRTVAQTLLIAEICDFRQLVEHVVHFRKGKLKTETTEPTAGKE